MNGEQSKIMDKPHKKLLCWQKSMELVMLIYKATEKFPREEIYGLTSQLRRASVSVPANISEGAADRTTNEFRNFLSIAIGSLSELNTLLEVARRIGYLEESEYAAVISLADECSALTFGLKKSLRV